MLWLSGMAVPHGRSRERIAGSLLRHRFDPQPPPALPNRHLDFDSVSIGDPELRHEEIAALASSELHFKFGPGSSRESGPTDGTVTPDATGPASMSWLPGSSKPAPPIRGGDRIEVIVRD